MLIFPLQNESAVWLSYRHYANNQRSSILNLKLWKLIVMCYSITISAILNLNSSLFLSFFITNPDAVHRPASLLLFLLYCNSLIPLNCLPELWHFPHQKFVSTWTVKLMILLICKLRNLSTPFYFLSCLIWGRDGIKVYLTNSIFLIVYKVYVNSSSQ